MIEFCGLFNPIPPTVFCSCLGIMGRGQTVPEIFWTESYITFYIINIINNFSLLFSKQQVIFKENNLEIVIECNMEIVDYLDIILNLNNGTFKHCHKTSTSSNIHNRTIFKEQNRINFQVLTCQQAYSRKTRQKRLASKKLWVLKIIKKVTFDIEHLALSKTIFSIKRNKRNNSRHTHTHIYIYIFIYNIYI